jgi:16S rRNA processing protein RimM
MKNANTNFIVVGKIGSTYGVHGWLKIQVYTEFKADLLDYQPWYLQGLNDQWDPIQIEDGKLYGKGIIAKLPGIHSPEEARLLTGKTIAIARSQLAALNENEYYWSDLIGLTVIDQKGETLGKVIYLMETGSNDVLVVKGEKEHAIPFLLGKVITNIDLAKQEIRVDWELP